MNSSSSASGTNLDEPTLLARVRSAERRVALTQTHDSVYCNFTHFLSGMIQAERTPNPNSLKFTTSSGHFSGDDIVAISSADEADRHPLGKRLFSIEGVDDVFITPDFVTVSKASSAEWNQLKSEVESVLTEYLDNQ